MQTFQALLHIKRHSQTGGPIRNYLRGINFGGKIYLFYIYIYLLELIFTKKYFRNTVRNFARSTFYL